MPTPVSADQLIARAKALAKSQSRDALELTLQARQRAAEQNLPDQEAAALCLQARILLLLSRNNEALAALAQVHALASGHDIGPRQGEALQLQGRALFSGSQYQQAAVCWQNCLALPSSAIDSKPLTRAHMGLGSIHFIRDQFDQALEHHRQAESLALNSDDPLLYSEAQLHLATIFVKQGQHATALALLKEALPQIRAAKNYTQEAVVYGLIGEIHIHHGELEKAQTSLMLALKINRLIANLPGEVINLILLGQCELRSQEIEGALDLLHSAHTLALESGSTHLLAQAEQGLAEACLATGQAREAEHHAAEYRRLRTQILDQFAAE